MSEWVVAAHQKDSQSKRDNKDKAEILNDQFQSVFTLDKGIDYVSIEGPTFPTIDNLTIHTKWG